MGAVHVPYNAYDPAPGKDLYELKPEDLEGQSMFTPTVLVWTGVVLLALAAFFVVLGLRRRRRIERDSMSADELRPLIAERALPFGVCTECRIVIELPHAIACPRCGRSHYCINVDSEEQRSLALAGIGSA